MSEKFQFTISKKDGEFHVFQYDQYKFIFFKAKNEKHFEMLIYPREVLVQSTH